MINKKWKKAPSFSDGITETHCYGMPKEFVGFALILSGVFLLIGSLFFVKFGQQETNSFLVPFEKDESRKLIKSEVVKRKYNLNKQKISIKKQIYVSLNLKRQLESNLNQLLRSWISDSITSDRISEVFIYADTSLPIESIPTIKVNQDQADEAKQYLKRFTTSLKNYNKISRALWFLDLSATSFINLDAINYISDNILSKMNPMKERIIIGNCITDSNCAILISRAAVKELLFSTDIMKELNLSLEKNEMKNVGMFSGFLNKETEFFLNSHSELPQCMRITNMTQLSQCFVLHLDENNRCFNHINFRNISIKDKYIGYDNSLKIGMCKG